MIAPCYEGSLPPVIRAFGGCLVSLAALQVWAGGTPGEWLVERDAARVTNALTSVFAHAEPSHAIYNCLTVVALGAWIERRLGRLALALLLVGGALGSVFAWVECGRAAELGGASGVAYTLLGACAVLPGERRHPVVVSWPLALGALCLSSPLVSWIALLALPCLVLRTWAGPLVLRARLDVRWLGLPLLPQLFDLGAGGAAAHVGGLASGVLLGAVVAPQAVRIARRQRHSRSPSPPTNAPSPSRCRRPNQLAWSQ